MTDAFDDPRHRDSEALAFDAERAWTGGDRARAESLYAEAASLEEAVAKTLTPSPSRDALAISAVALWYKAARFDEVRALAYHFLASASRGATARELEDLVERAQRESVIARLDADPGMVPVEVKLDGGRVRRGIAPAPAAQRRSYRVMSLLMRVADLEAKQPYRERGESELVSNDEIQIYEVPARAASYGLRFYVATGTQQVTAPVQKVAPDQVVRRFLELAAAAADGPDSIRAVVPDAQYASAFIEGFGEVAPDGEDIGEVTCDAPTWKIRRPTATTFEPRHRQSLRDGAKPERTLKPGEIALEGKLATLHIDGGAQFFNLDVGGREERVLIENKRLFPKAAALWGQKVRAVVKFSKIHHCNVARDLFART